MTGTEHPEAPGWLRGLLTDQPFLLGPGPTGVPWSQGEGHREFRAILSRDPDERLPALSDLDRMGPDLTALAANGGFPRPLLLRPELLQPLVSLLAQGRSCLLEGEPGVGKTYLLWQLAYAFSRAPDGFPPSLQRRPLRLVNASAFQEGCLYMHEFETKVRAVVEPCLENRSILAIEQGWLLARAGASDIEDPRTLANLLLPWLDRGLQLLVLTHPEGAGWMRRANPAFASRLVPVSVPPLPEGATLDLLRAVTAGAACGPEVAREALTLGRLFIRGALPRAAVDLVNEALAVCEGPASLTCRDLYAAVQRRTGLPASLVDPGLPLPSEAVREVLASRIYGQEEAVEAVVDAVMTLKARMHPERTPLSVLLFVGPTGVGKTELARQLAAFLFGSPDRVVRWDMGAFVGPEGLARFLGMRDRATELDEILARPMSVALFDEVEKSDRYLFDALLSILGEGRIVNGRGQLVSFRGCVVILTSNVGSELFRGRRASLKADLPARVLEGMVLRRLESHFRPEFLNRIHRIVVFRPLSGEVVQRIAQREIDEVRARLRESWPDVRVLIDESVMSRCVKEGYDPGYGARPMQRAVSRLVVAPLSRHLAAHPACKGGLLVTLRDGAPAVIHTAE
jgi:ATP-dependent Clp protease ATP-binding subunit ClpA